MAFSLNHSSLEAVYSTKGVNLLKTASLFLIVAIANPMCCCLTLVDTDLPEELSGSFDPHACCSSESEDLPQAMGDGECPHEADMQSKIAQFDSGDGSHKPLDFLVGLLAVDALSKARQLELAGKSRVFKPIEMGAGESLSEAYCIYLL